MIKRICLNFMKLLLVQLYLVLMFFHYMKIGVSKFSFNKMTRGIAGFVKLTQPSRLGLTGLCQVTKKRSPSVFVNRDNHTQAYAMYKVIHAFTVHIFVMVI